MAAVLGLAPLRTIYPAVGVDSSWEQGLATAQMLGIRFGDGLVYTSGPLTSIYTRAPAPDLPVAPFLTGVAYCILTALLLWRLLGPGLRWWVVAIAVLVLTGGFVSSDTTYLAPAFLVPFVVLLDPAPGRPPPGDGWAWRDRQVWWLAAISTPVGLIPLVKFSATPLGFLGLALSAAFLVARRQHARAAAVCLAPAATFFGAWLLTGQSLRDLPEWTRLSIEISAGFSDTMYVAGPRGQVVVFGLSALVLLLVVLVRRPVGVSRPAHLALVLVVSFTVFLIFKSGFTRQDGHVLNAASTFLVLGLVLATRLGRIAALSLAVTSATVWIYMNETAVGYPGAVSQLESGLDRSWVAGPGDARDQVLDRDGLRRRYAEAERAIRDDRHTPAAPGGGTVDLYTIELSYLLAQDADWSPRPVIQSYAAYTPELAALNRRHLEGPNRPDHLMLNQTPIDNRWPALEDGASWLTMARYYDAGSPDAEQFSQLDVRETPREVTYGKERTVSAKAGVRIRLKTPRGGWDGLVAKVDIEPTAVGRLRTLLFRPTPVTIVPRTVDQRVGHYRFLPSMGSVETVISPWVTSTADVVSLINQETADAPLQQMESVRFDIPGAGRYWDDEVTVTYRPFRIEE